METKMNKDEFAKFLANEILEIKMYNFDVLYDIKKIVDELCYNSQTDTPRKKEYHLMLRETGCDLVNPESKHYKTCLDRSSKIYSLKFCWNSAYFSNEVFCEVSRI